MKVVALIIILGLCTNVCYSSVYSPSQYLSSTWLKSAGTKVYNAASQSDAEIFNQNALTTVPGSPTGVPFGNVVFGPGTTNDTAYVYAFTKVGDNLDKMYRRTLNTTIIAEGFDFTMASVLTTEEITSTTPASDYKTAVAPGYLAILSTGFDGATPGNKQVYLNIISSDASEKKLTSTSDVQADGGSIPAVGQACTSTSFGIGNIWYDIGADAFLYTYWKKVETEDIADALGFCKGTIASTTFTIWLGGYHLNGSTYLTIPGISAIAIGVTNEVTFLTGGGDNWSNSSYIYIMYKDATIFPGAIYYSKTDKAITTTAIGSFEILVADDATPDTTKTYTPLSVWASNYAYGMAVGCKNQTSTTVYNYPIWNFVNGTTNPVDSGLAFTSVSDSTGDVTDLVGWPLATGYTLVGGWLISSGTIPTVYYQIGTFNANRTVYNQTPSALIEEFQGPINFFEDVHGTMWVGWTEMDPVNEMTYAGYLAKIQLIIEEEIQLNTNYYFVGILISTFVVFLTHNLIAIWA